MKEFIKEKLVESANLKLRVAEELSGEIAKIAEAIQECYKNNGKVILFGNGGSAADAQHIACELISKFRAERASLAAISLTTNTSILTAIGNDYSFDRIFERQIEGLLTGRDIAVGISTSGNSTNVILALKKANAIGAKTVALTGRTGGKLAGIADLIIKVPSDDTPRIQEAHIVIGHIICDLVERAMFGNE